MDNSDIYNTGEYRRSRVSYFFAAMFEYFITLAVGDAFLSALAKYIGLSDALTGICLSVASLACVSQLLTVFVKQGKAIKRLIITINLIDQLMYACLYFLPFFGLSDTVKQVLFVLLLISAAFTANSVASVKYTFALGGVKREKFGSYCLTNEMISLSGGIIFTYVLGRVSDCYIDGGKQELSFIVFGITLLVITALHTVSMLLMRKDADSSGEMSEQNAAPGVQLKEMFGLFGNPAFRSVFLIFALWKAADCAVYPFMNTYALDKNTLGLTLTQISLFVICGNVGRILISFPTGKIIDKTSYCTVMIPFFAVSALSMLSGAITSPGRAGFFAAYIILRNISYVGLSSGLYNLALDYLPRKLHNYSVALMTALTGLLGFISTAVCSLLLSYVQNNGNVIFGMHIYPQQLLSTIGCVIAAAIIPYVYIKIRKLPRNIN